MSLPSKDDAPRWVVNVRVKYIRPKYNDLKEWCEDPQNIYIGRSKVVFLEGERYPPYNSEWCNPYKIGTDGVREEVLKKYEKYMRNKLKKEPKLLESLKKLKGKTLGCWCVPEKCHGEILLKLIEENS